MASTAADKARFQDSIKDTKKKISEMEEKLSLLEKDIKEKDDQYENYRRIVAAHEYLKLITMYISMSDAAIECLGKKNENYLNEARKLYYTVLKLLEEFLPKPIDMNLTENEDALDTIPKIDPRRKINLFNKMGYVLDLIRDGWGENSKYKWSFVDLEGRFANIMKNMIDYRECLKNTDPRKEFYHERNQLLQMVKERLEIISKRFREKYEQSTKEPDDMRMAIDFMTFLRRIASLSNQPDEAGRLKRIVELMRNHMEKNLEKEEQEKAKAKAKKKKKKK